MSSTTHPQAAGPPADHSAADAAMGYLYQAKWALLELVRGSVIRPDAAISIELYDDIAWDQAESPVDLVQLKHHLKSSRDLTDLSPDLWRTIAAWLDAGAPNDPDGPVLTLVTTQTAAAGSAAAALRPIERRPEQALRQLESVARQSTAVVTHDARQRFMAMSPSSRAQFVRRIRVLDGSPTIADVDRLVQSELRIAIPVGREAAFLERLWGWWLERVVEMLRGESRRMNALTLRAFLDDARADYTPENLPTFADLKLSDDSTSQYDNHPFVHQLRWIQVREASMRKAMSDYYRSYAHTVRWLQEDLVGIEELQRFEDGLVDEWETEFELMRAELPDDADEAAKQKIGREILRSRLQQTTLRVRDRYNEPFFARGKHHELANVGHIGWHPEFNARFNALTLSRTA